MSAVEDEQIEHVGRKQSAGTSSRPRGTRKQAAAGVVASVLAEQAQVTGDAEYLEAAAESAERSGGVGAPEVLPDDDIDRFEDLGISVTGQPAGAPPAPLMPVSTDLIPREEPVEASESDSEATEEDAPGLSLAAAIDAEIAAYLADDDVDEADLVAEVEDEDVEDEDPQDPTVDYEIDDEDYIPEGFEDPRLVEERKARTKAEKQLARYKQEEQKQARRKWLTDDAPRFPAVPAARAIEIAKTSSSRRDFVRAMNAMNTEFAEHVQRLLEQEREASQQQAAQVVERERDAVRSAWGNPVASVPAAVGGGSAEDDEMAVRRARARGGYQGVMKERMQQLMRKGFNL